MAIVRGFMNVYRSGFFHSPGKPGAFDRHAGDFYATEEAALLAIDPPSHYVCTVPIEWNEASHPPVNPMQDQFGG